MVTVEGKIMFGTIMTYLFTWDKMVLNRIEKTVRSVLDNLTFYDCYYTYILIYKIRICCK